MTERHLDDAIDRAARGMMAVDADGSFRARLAARLERAHGGAAFFTWPRLLAVGAAAGILVLALVLPLERSASRTAGNPETSSTAAVERPVPADARPARGAQEMVPEKRTADQRTASGPVPVPAAAEAGRARRTARAGHAKSPAQNVTQQIAAGTVSAAAIDAGVPPGAAAVHSGPGAVTPIAPISVAPIASDEILPAAIVIPPLEPLRDVRVAPLFQSVERN